MMTMGNSPSDSLIFIPAATYVFQNPIEKIRAIPAWVNHKGSSFR
jgi:hypothetical protein